MTGSSEQQRLAEADRRVAFCERRLFHQREIISELERGGEDPATARLLLGFFQESLALHIEYRDRLRRRRRSK